jgi:hypothetical protein
MPYCEECGAKLSAGVRFCEECGTPVASTGDEGGFSCASVSSFDLFAGSDWKSNWAAFVKDAAGLETGIILTRQSALLSQVGMDGDDFASFISEYAGNCRNRGVAYAYLGLDPFPGGNGSSVSSVVVSLRKVVDVARPKYLFILGSETVVDVVRWENEGADNDNDVPSDLCYSTLDTNSPWKGQRYDFDEVVRVGRLPTFPDETADEFTFYFENVTRHTGRLGKTVPYGLSALVWEKESNNEYGAISSQTVDVSPDVEKNSVGQRIGDDVNLMFFNLHGSDGDKYWYGQEGEDYPEAFSPQVLADRDGAYMLGVEACYGAKFIGGLGPHDSILLTALQNKCLAFLGSSRIAYGQSNPEGSCADIVVGTFVKCLADGQSAGDAHCEGLKRLFEDNDAPDDSDIKTLAEFALYGDPSVRMNASRAQDVQAPPAWSRCEFSGLRVPMPDVRRAVSMALAQVNARIEGLVDDFVARNVLPEFGRIGIGAARQKTVKMRNSGLYQKIYALERGPVRTIAKVYFDAGGRIRKAVVSK